MTDIMKENEAQMAMAMVPVPLSPRNMESAQKDPLLQEGGLELR